MSKETEKIFSQMNKYMEQFNFYSEEQMEKEMKNYDPYKRTILFFASLVNIILMTAIFAYAWYGYYA